MSIKSLLLLRFGVVERAIKGVIPRFDFMIIIVIVIINIELRYYMCVHSKMGVDNFVVLQIGKKIKILVHTIWCGN